MTFSLALVTIMTGAQSIDTPYSRKVFVLKTVWQAHLHG